MEEIKPLQQAKVGSKKLKVFTNDVETWVALDKDDLAEVYKEFYGETMAEIGEDIEEWYQVADDYPITIRFEDEDFHPNDPKFPKPAHIQERDGLNLVTAPASEWAMANGRGFLCSTEF